MLDSDKSLPPTVDSKPSSRSTNNIYHPVNVVGTLDQSSSFTRVVLLQSPSAWKVRSGGSPYMTVCLEMLAFPSSEQCLCCISTCKLPYVFQPICSILLLLPQPSPPPAPPPQQRPLSRTIKHHHNHHRHKHQQQQRRRRQQQQQEKYYNRQLHGQTRQLAFTHAQFTSKSHDSHSHASLPMKRSKSLLPAQFSTFVLQTCPWITHASTTSTHLTANQSAGLFSLFV